MDLSCSIGLNEGELMNTDPSANGERITARVPPNVKARLEQASELSGASSLSQFIVRAALKEADAIFEREQVIQLHENASQTFFALLDNPLAPNERMKAAVAKYKKAGLHESRASEQEP
jgi:uncharacterized protein (DUF1778 family)